MTLYDALRTIVGQYVIRREEIEYNVDPQPQEVEPLSEPVIKVIEVGTAQSPLGEMMPYLPHTVREIRQELNKIIIMIENY